MKCPPSTEYVAHRQDQSVLGLLAYDWLLKHGSSVQLNIQKYMLVTTQRDQRAKSISYLNP